MPSNDASRSDHGNDDFDGDTVDAPPPPTASMRGNLLSFKRSPGDEQRTNLVMPALRRPAAPSSGATPRPRTDDDHATLITSAPRAAHGTPAPVLFARGSALPLFARVPASREASQYPWGAPVADTAPMAPWAVDPAQTFVPEAFLPVTPEPPRSSGLSTAPDPADTFLEVGLAAIAPMAPVAPVAPVAQLATPAVVPPPAVEAPAPASPSWETYHRLGLAPRPQQRLLGSLMVSLYRLLGFAILTTIVVVLVGYIVTTTFYYLNTTWITPIAISPSDEKVVALQTQLAEQQNLRDRLANEIADADHAIAVQQAFQAEFGKAIESDLAGRRAALSKLRTLAGEAAGTRKQIHDTNDDYAAESKARTDKEYEANLIDRNQMLNSKYQLAQITSANLSLAERQAELELRAADLAASSRSLAALLDKADHSALSYDALKIKQELATSKLALDKLLGDRDTVRASLVRQDKIIAGLKSSSYLRAVNDHATVAFVPYSNLHTMKHGDPLYGCKVGMVVCHQVGTVLEVLSGEVSFKHPHRDKLMRGQMVELDLQDPQAAEDDVMFAGDKPLWF